MVTFPRGLPPLPPLPPGLEGAAGAGADKAPVPDTSHGTEHRLASIEALLARGLVTRGDWALGEVSSPTVLVGNSMDLDMKVQDLQGKSLPFSLFTISQVEIAAPQLVAADAVRLRIYRRGTRRNPLDVMAEYDGTSHTSGMWVASFSKQDLEYRDENEMDTIWLQVRNTAANSAATSFTIRIHGSAFPARAP